MRARCTDSSKDSTSASCGAAVTYCKREYIVGRNRCRAVHVLATPMPSVQTITTVAMSWTPDGSRQAKWTQTDVQICDAQDAVLSRVHSALVHRLAWSLDGQRLAITDYTARVCRVVDASKPEWAPELQLVVVHDELKQGMREVAWLPDSTRLAVGTQKGQCMVADAATGAVVAKMEAAGGPTCAMAWAPDGLKLATGGNNTWVLDQVTGDKVFNVPWKAGWDCGVMALQWSLDGQRVAVQGRCGEDGDERFFHAEVWVVDGASWAVLATVKGWGDGRPVRWSPAGDLLAVGQFEGHRSDNLRDHSSCLHTLCPRAFPRGPSAVPCSPLLREYVSTPANVSDALVWALELGLRTVVTGLCSLVVTRYQKGAYGLVLATLTLISSRAFNEQKVYFLLEFPGTF